MKLLKSKIVLGVVVAAGLAFAGSVSAAYVHTTTLKMGMTNSQVMSLQQTLNMTSCKVAASGAGSMGSETMYFGGLTKAAVMCFQTANALVADGIVGAFTGGKLQNVTGGPVTGTPGCPTGALFNTITGASCTNTTSLPTGCTSTAGYSPINGVKCDTTTSTPNTPSGPLQGGAGDVTISSSSTDVEDTVGEGDTENVLAFEVEAEDSDVNVTSVRVVLVNDGFDAGDGSSENLTRYIDEVTIMMDDEEVGSADASDFSKDSGSPDEFSKSIALSGAVIREGDEARFHVAVKAVDTIEEDDQEDADWNVLAETIRFEDATGAILTADVDETNNFDFEDASENDEVSLKASSENPDDTNVQVDEDDESEDTLGLVAKLDVDEDSSDIEVTSLTVTVDVTNFDSTGNDVVDGSDDIDVSATSQWASRIIDTVTVTVGDEEFEADLDDNVGAAQDVVNGDGTVTYTVDFDGDVMIDAGDIEDIEVSFVFNSQDGNYNDGVVVQATLANEDIEAETEDDEITVDGSDQIGAELTLTISGATVEVDDTTHSQSENADVGTFTFEVTITAEDADVDVDATSVVETLLGGTDTSYTSISIVNTDSDAQENGANDYTVLDGESNTFAITYTHDPDAAGSYYVRLDSIAGIVVDELNGPESLVAAP